MKILVIRSVLTMSFLEGTVPPYHRNGLFHSTLYTPMDDQQGKFDLWTQLNGNHTPWTALN